MRTFALSGACDPLRHHIVPAERRLPAARGLVEKGEYFSVHGSRRSGKSTTIVSLARALVAEASHAAVVVSCAVARHAESNHVEAQRELLAEIRRQAKTGLPPQLRPPPWPDAPDELLFANGVECWSQRSPRPVPRRHRFARRRSAVAPAVPAEP